ncbi:MAG TPA: nuclear transport factor 2 family protein [Vicinamibacterales bacterium]|nr:nuclear transport factor 2 family protein [Vicinamibacterales bacterium]
MSWWRRLVGCTIAALAGSVAPIAAQSRDTQSTIAFVQRLQDTEDIRNVLIRYGRLLDARDLEGYANLFARDGEWSGGFGDGKGGPVGILAFMKAQINPSPSAQPPASYHVMSNFLIDVHGDTATAWSRWTFMSVDRDNKAVVSQGGHYDDTLVRENGEWKFKRRVVTREVPRRGSKP